MKLKNLLKGTVCIVTGIVLILFREESVQGIKQGITTSLEVLIPSLFPFMVLSSFAVRCGVFSGSGGRAGKLFQKITGLPVSSFAVILFGFTGGYPVGMNVAVSLYENGVIDRKSALRLSSFCVNAGPAFIITAVGNIIFGSSAAGIRLFLCVCISSLITGVITGFFIKSDNMNLTVKYIRQPLSDAFIDSVESSCKNMILMCAWVMLFSCFSGIISVSDSGILADLWSVFGEVTAGVSAAGKIGGLPLTAACISSGGLCVMCQLLPSIKKCGVRITEYLTFRIVNSVISFVLMKIILIISPMSVETFACNDMALGTGNMPASLMLLVTGVVFVADMSSGKVRNFTIDELF